MTDQPTGWGRKRWNSSNVERANAPFKNLFSKDNANQRPTIVCLCGSTRFGKAFADANLRETLAGRIVLTIGCNMRDDDLFAALDPEELRRIKLDLDELHKRKIDLADEILVLNVDGYVGSSTHSEIDYAVAHGKPVRWLEPSLAVMS